MNNTANLLRLGLTLLLALILQIVVLDNLDFLGPCNPFVYIVFIMAATIRLLFRLIDGHGCGGWSDCRFGV